MSGYGSGTSVDAGRSKDQIETMLIAKLGAGQVQNWTDVDNMSAGVMFRYNHFIYKIDITLPNPKEFETTPTGRQTRSKDQIKKQWDQAVRQRWRSIWLRVRVLVDLIEMSDFKAVNQLLLGYIVLPDGTTAYDYYTPKLEAAYKDGKMPKALLPGGIE